MHARDSGARSKTALTSAHSSAHASPLSPGLSQGFFQALAPALALTLVLGWGLADAPFHASQGALTEQAVPLVPAVALPTGDAADAAPPMNGWRERRAERAQPWRGEAGSETADFDASACGGDCIKALRQRLLDHHRQAAPVWVF